LSDDGEKKRLTALLKTLEIDLKNTPYNCSKAQREKKKNKLIREIAQFKIYKEER
jgi:hypothetical protein